MFHRLRAFRSKSYQRESLEKTHQNGNCKTIKAETILLQKSNQQLLDYRSTALPPALEKMSPCMINFGHLSLILPFVLVAFTVERKQGNDEKHLA